MFTRIRLAWGHGARRYPPRRRGLAPPVACHTRVYLLTLSQAMYDTPAESNGKQNDLMTLEYFHMAVWARAR